MYAQLKINPALTNTNFAPNVTVELVKILTGQVTDVSQLDSAVIDVANSALVNTVTAGWELVAGPAAFAFGTQPDYGYVLRAPCVDNATQYKYIGISGSSYSTGNTVHFTVGTGYDAVNKKMLDVPHNNGILDGSTAYPPSYNWGVLVTTYSTGTNHNINISASARHLAVHCVTGATNIASDVRGVFELTRKDLWNTPAAGYSNWVATSMPITTGSTAGQSNSSGLGNAFGGASAVGAATITTKAAASLAISNYFNDTTATSSTMTNNGWGSLAYTTPWGCVTPSQVGFDTPGESLFMDASGVRRHILLPWGASNNVARYRGGEASSMCGIYATTPNFGTTYDTIVYNGDTYVVWNVGTTAAFAVKRV